MGDILHTLPAVESLHRSDPTARIHWIAEDRWHPLLEGHPSIATLLGFDRKAIWQTRQRLRQINYDLAIDFQGLIKSALVAWQSGARRVVGSARTRESLAG